ncbi:hypothetical protein DPMN_094746 [Dreissena polymorpha]|uniref:Uncharacterized protein n=1 Tax=Dreissena polymorpha TaxID=45954 RepID=A0A9D4L6N4_DREPO|nr:hypothetical protein DPMN_094746 [Dreissena polymorpha]
MSSLESIKNRNSRSRPDILTSILERHQQCLDKSLKVTAHVNISGNEQADMGAKDGLLRGAVDAGESLAPTEIYSLTKKFVVGQWNLRTDNLASVDILLPDPRKPSGRLTDTQQALCLKEPSRA